MADVNFEEIKEKNVPEVLNIYTYYVLNTTATFHAVPPSIEDMRELVIFKNDKYKAFLIKENEATCGYAILTQHKKREAYDGTAEVTIYLKPEFVGKGIGSLAVKFVEEYAKKKDIHVLIATICGENSKSINVFERNGFNRCAHYKEVGKKFGKLLDIVAYQKIIG